MLLALTLLARCCATKPERLAATVSCSGTEPAVVARGTAATRTAMVLSDLLSRADARAGELAKAYDSA